MRRAVLAVMLTFLTLPAQAVAMLDLYQARPVVTGTGETNRKIGFALALEEVLFKVSGDARLYGDPRVDALSKDAGAMVASFDYYDRYSGRQIHDEQGSYDRPHDLTVTFDHAKIDAALAELGLKPWAAERPKLAVLIGVTKDDRSFEVTADAARDADMRDSLDKASFRTNLPAVVPGEAALAAAKLDAEAVSVTDPVDLAALANDAGASVALVGTLDFSDAAHGWITTWRLVGPDGRTYEWGEVGVSYDDAFRNGLRGAAQVLSGHGAPPRL